MKWWAKAFAFQALSRLPGGQPLYHAAQRHLTGNSRQTEGRLTGKIEQTLRYWRWLTSNAPESSLRQATHLDLGSGWVPSVPVTFHALGIERQYLVDIMPHLERAAVVETIGKFRALATAMGSKFVRMPELPTATQSMEEILRGMGMTYAAPYDELACQIAGTVGFVTATHMLNHLNRATLVSLCLAVKGLLAPGGYFLGLLHFRQLFDGLHSRTPFYALRYSDAFWERYVNSPMMSYNRLKGRDYRAVFAEAGFEIAHFEVDPGKPEDFQLLEQQRIHPAFESYTPAELAARHLFFAARKPSR